MSDINDLPISPFVPPADDPYVPQTPPTDLAAVVRELLARVDGRIDGKLEAHVQELNTYLEERDAAIQQGFDNVYLVLADVLAGGEVGIAERWREFVVAEARRLEVRPSEVLAKDGGT